MKSKLLLFGIVFLLFPLIASAVFGPYTVDESPYLGIPNETMDSGVNWAGGCTFDGEMTCAQDQDAKYVHNLSLGIPGVENGLINFTMMECDIKVLATTDNNGRLATAHVANATTGSTYVWEIVFTSATPEIDIRDGQGVKDVIENWIADGTEQHVKIVVSAGTVARRCTATVFINGTEKAKLVNNREAPGNYGCPQFLEFQATYSGAQSDFVVDNCGAFNGSEYNRAGPPPPITINNTKPNITLDYPTSGTSIDNSTLYPLKINGTVTIQNGSVMNTTINDTNWFNYGNNTNFNYTFNGTFREGLWIINITTNSTHGNQTSLIFNFTIDVTTPTTEESTLNGNFTLNYAYANITFQINISDNNNIHYYNISTPEGYGRNATDVNVSLFIFNGSINVSNYGIGRHNITAYYCDVHTSKKIKTYDIAKDTPTKKLTYTTSDDMINIKLKSSTATITDFNTYKDDDRYVFWYDFLEPESKTIHNYIFEIDGNTLSYIAGSRYKAHFVGEKSWVDFEFEGNDGAVYNVRKTKEDNYEVEIQTPKTYLEFKSVGDLNCGNNTWIYYIYNYTATFSDSVIETTVEEFILQFDFKDVFLNGSGILNYSNVAYTTNNVTGLNQINFTYNLSIPSVISNISNSTFWWELDINDTIIKTINYSQEVTRIQITDCSTSLTSIRTLNITFYNEQLVTELLEADLDALFNVWTNDSTNYLNFTFAFRGDTNYSICIFPNTTINVNAQMFYNTTDGFRQRWFLRSVILTKNASLLSLYNFKTTTGIDELRGTLRDTNYNFFPLIFTQLLRFYTAENVWRTVQMDQSDDNGQVVFNIIEATEDYKLYFQQGSTIIDTTDTLKFLCDTDDICTVNFIVEETLVVTAPIFSYFTGYSNISEVYQLNWSDTTGLTSQVRLLVTQETGRTSTTVCDTTVSASSGTINCNTTGKTGTLKVQIFTAQSPLLPEVIEFLYKRVDELFQLAAIGINDAGLWATGISTSFIIAGSIIHPIFGIITYIFSLIIINALGILGFITITFITIMAVIGIAVSMLMRKN